MMKSVLLAPNEQLDFDDPRIKYPMLGSLKFDGTRCICVDGELLSRSMKPQKNPNLPEALAELVAISRNRRLVFDFELYDHTLPNHGAHTSILASHEADIPDSMRCHIFDAMSLDEWERVGHDFEPMPFAKRQAMYREIVREHPSLKGNDRYVAVEQVEVSSAVEARDLFEVAVEEEYEGIMLRCPNAGYKHGRATHNEGLIFKFKQFETVDGRIIEVVQRRRLKDGIERTQTPTGHTERVHRKDAYELDDMVGAFKVLFPDGTESEVNYGKGFDHSVRREHWANRHELIGRMVEVRHLPHGAKDGIRIGTLVRFRPDKDPQ